MNGNHRNRANEALRLVREMADRSLIASLERSLAAFLEKNNVEEFSATTCRRYVNAGIRSRSEHWRLATRWVEEIVPLLLKNDLLTTRVKQVLATDPSIFRDRMEDDAVKQPNQAIVGNHEDVRKAFKLLFGMEVEHYSVSTEIVDEYFGYRRSSHKGEIIRFYVKIAFDAETGLLNFKNLYRRHPDRWVVNGKGWDIDGLTHLSGHAKSHEGAKRGLGLRSFVLTKFRALDWYVGLLNSLDNRQDPIGARVVLIPLSQHSLFKNVEPENKQNEIINAISKSVLPSQIDAEIDGNNNELLNDIPYSILIQSLIWNGSLRTLHGAPMPIPAKEDYYAYERLFQLQERALLKRWHPNDIRMFVDIMKYDDVFSALSANLPVKRSVERKEEVIGPESQTAFPL